MSAPGDIPMAVCSVVGRHLGQAYYHHETLDGFFHEAGAPGDPPEGSCVVKCTQWLKRCSNDPDTNGLRVLGDVLRNFMDEWPNYHDEIYEKRKTQIEAVLAKCGLRYDRGHVIGGTSSTAAKDLRAIIQTRDIPSLAIEFERAVTSVEADPATAVTAACAILEAFCNVYIEREGIERPTKLGAQTLWKTVRDHMAINPSADMDNNLKRILSGLASVVTGISSLRNSSGSAHGRGRQEYRVEGRHARLAVNSAHALVVFLMEVWDHRKDGDRLKGQSL